MKNKKFWQWKNEAASESGEAVRVLELNGTIAEDSWFDDDITPKMFRDELFAGSGDVVIWINSPGGTASLQARSTPCSWTTPAMSPSRSTASPHPLHP